jgi:predicted amidohydrolase YtcJ
MAAADGAIIGARIRTLDPERPSASAVAWRQGTIIAIGDDSEVREVCDARTELIDVNGAAIVPGLVDAHFHPLLGVEWTRGGVDLTMCQSLDKARKLLAAEKAKVNGGWVVGYGLAYHLFPDGEVDGSLLADSVDGGPAFIYLYDGHAAVATPRALEVAGITGARPLAGTAEIVCRNGVPTGELREAPASELVRLAIPERTAAERYTAYVEAMRGWNALGLTGVHAMDGTPKTFDLLRELEGGGDLTLRMVVPLTQEPDMSLDEHRALRQFRDECGELWRAGVAKFFIDGTVDAGTAWLFEADTKGECTRPYWPDPGRYAEIVALFAEAGFQCATHAIGDRAVAAALDAYRAAGHVDGVRHRIEHIETLRDEELVRFEPEQVIASMQPLAADMSFDGDKPTWPARLGPVRTARGWRYGDLKRRGVCVALGSDWPIAPADPRLGIASAQLRRPPWRLDMEPYGPEQALTAIEALEGYTVEPARAVGEQGVSGAVRVGKRADLTGFEHDPVDCAAPALPDLPVTLTVVGGRVVYQSD